MHNRIIDMVRGIRKMNPRNQIVVLCIHQLIDNKQKENGSCGPFTVTLGDMQDSIISVACPTLRVCDCIESETMELNGDGNGKA